MPTPNLGAVVTEYIHTARDITCDPMNSYVGYTPDPTPQLERVVQRHGFPSIDAFIDEVTERTNHRWVYFHLMYY